MSFQLSRGRAERESVPTNRFLAAVRDFLYGFSGLEFEHQALQMRGALETVFFVATLGDMLGLPVIPPFYSLRILPYVMPHLGTWKRRVLRPREMTDNEEFHLHGM
jgi:hypothetical protein